MQKQDAIISKVDAGMQAVVIVLLAKNENGAPILDSQKQAAEAMAKNVLQLAGAEVFAQSSSILLDSVNSTVRLTTTVETVEAIEEPTANEEE